MKCPCHSNKEYFSCCQPYHSKKKFAETPTLLMRSRYAAYALNLPVYIIDTTHPSRHEPLEPWIQSIRQFSKTTSFDGLIIEAAEGETVTFLATLHQGDHDVSFREKSVFEKIDGKWFYKTGVVSPL